jgi:hypothetical protein
LTDPKYSYHCVIPWTQRSNPIYYWDTLCAEAVELFGLPGDRYVTDVGEFSMTWSFKDNQDAVLFRLKFGEVVA